MITIKKLVGKPFVTDGISLPINGFQKWKTVKN